ncbi:MAG: hypothetical protein IJ125_03215 [Atopobiaceae bacterium]|nr:hypothetical protein [Atopobiaceae bacterium]
MSVTPEMRELATEYLVEMMIEGRAEQQGVSPRELFGEFRRSRTMEALFDEGTGLWMNGPDYLSDEWDIELYGTWHAASR